MDLISFFFGVSGNVTSLMIFLSPIGTFLKVVKNKSTEKYDSLPYVCALLSSCLWTYYGIKKPDGLLVATVNGFGILIESVYVALFLLFAPTKMKAKTMAMAAILDVGFPVAAILITRLTLQEEAQINTLGFLCAGLNIITYGSPLAAMGRVVTTKSAEYLPFSLSFSICINGAIWTIYAILVHDYFIGVSNGSGFVLGAAQLVLYYMYPSKHKVGALEEKGQHEPLILPSEQEVDCNNQV
ncbi:bidirectional sugar transporter SWEET17-like [Olea europaea var. sylvestris]|uniref:bidirectional sugar transporter SWEET17-like n=2 Tax=Olea europaea var. sylvestris TaxID=158386 RepID=UPI000C1D316B|nr:bidirectional sugar transporter SWEET17-like [Olea europaea var. sylvestris]